MIPEKYFWMRHPKLQTNHLWWRVKTFACKCENILTWKSHTHILSMWKDLQQIGIRTMTRIDALGVSGKRRVLWSWSFVDDHSYNQLMRPDNHRAFFRSMYWKNCSFSPLHLVSSQFDNRSSNLIFCHGSGQACASVIFLFPSRISHSIDTHTKKTPLISAISEKSDMFFPSHHSFNQWTIRLGCWSVNHWVEWCHFYSTYFFQIGTWTFQLMQNSNFSSIFSFK